MNLKNKITVVIPFFNEELEISDLVSDLSGLEKKKKFLS